MAYWCLTIGTGYAPVYLKHKDKFLVGRGQTMKINSFNRRQFLKTGLLAGMSSPLLASEQKEDIRIYGPKAGTFGGRPSFSNWTGNIKARPRVLLAPKRLEDIQEAVFQARKVKAVGSGHSFSPCAYTDETMIRTDGLKSILHVDKQQRRVKVEAGIKLSDLNEQLYQLGFALPSLGDIDVQALAGAMATGTHGTGMQWGSFSDSSLIHEMDLILADGSLLQLSEDREEDRPALEAARLGLGVLGFVYAVTLNVVEARNLELHSRLMSIDEALDPRHYLENDHFEFFRFPFTDKVQAISRNITDKPVKSNAIKNFFDKIVLENIVLGGVLGLSSLNPSVMPRVMQILTGLVPDEKSVDRSDKIMTNTRWVKAFEIEHAIPIHKAAEMHERFAEIVDDFSKRDKDPFYANFPCECRFIRADKGTLLSPTQGSESCYFSVTSHVAFPGYEPFFREVEQALLDVGGRPHWGKQFYQNPVELYPDFASFQAWKDRWDPEGKFSNIYWDRLVSNDEMLNELKS